MEKLNKDCSLQVWCPHIPEFLEEFQLKKKKKILSRVFHEITGKFQNLGIQTTSPKSVCPTQKGYRTHSPDRVSQCLVWEVRFPYTAKSPIPKSNLWTG